jgi:transcriptional regulator GlxA family with amidase domain
MNVRQRTVGIVMFDGVEVLDFCGPFEVFSVAASPDVDEDGGLFRAVTIARTTETVTCIGGLLVQPHHTIADHPDVDILVIPGGQGTRAMMRDSQVLDWMKRLNATTELTCSVCTGSLVLAQAGLLDGLRATSHWSVIDLMRKLFPAVDVLSDAHFVDQGHIVTSAGISAGIDMALHVVERLHGPGVAAWTARRMEYDRPLTTATTASTT